MSEEYTKPSKEQFAAYVDVQMSGVTNMLDVTAVIAYASEPLTQDICLYIMKHYAELKEEYQL